MNVLKDTSWDVEVQDHTSIENAANFAYLPSIQRDISTYQMLNWMVQFPVGTEFKVQICCIVDEVEES